MSWCCLRVQPRQERRVLSLLSEAGVTAYAPMETRKVTVKHPHRPGIRRTVAKTAALIPSYCFAYLPDDRALDATRSIRLVREIMADKLGKPKAVDLARLRGLFLADAFRLFDQTYEAPKAKGYQPRWAKKQSVKVSSGAMEGWIGEVIGFRGRRQIEVMFTVFGRQREMLIDDDKLVSAMAMEAA